MLLEDEELLVELGIAFADLIPQDCDLRVLAAQAKHCGACDVGVVNVAGNQPAKVVRILARSAASAFMK